MRTIHVLVYAQAIDLLKGLLERDPEKRAGGEQVLHHEWLRAPATQVKDMHSACACYE